MLVIGSMPGTIIRIWLCDMNYILLDENPNLLVVCPSSKHEQMLIVFINKSTWSKFKHYICTQCLEGIISVYLIIILIIELGFQFCKQLFGLPDLTKFLQCLIYNSMET